ncbi:hypothetical protein CL621_02070 [archaeon]|nr:hypothetical protein [archaeon]|tara:strand:+ start:6059 stop:6880 length:822 start_codon:yes stop_codon:yes gene_type:complete
MKIKIGILFFVLLALFPIVSATSIIIDMKDSFNVNEKISFDYKIISENPMEIKYMVSVKCPDAPSPLLIIMDGTTPLTKTYTYMTSISEKIEPQTCIAGVAVLSPEEIIGEKSFNIITNPGFDFSVLTCEDLECTRETKIFVKNTDIYLDYTSELSELTTTATLIYPSKSTHQLTLPTTIKAEQIGNYELEVKASKEGHKTITRKIQLGVIGQEANIGYTKVEDIGKDIKAVEISKINILYIILPTIVVLLIIGLTIYYLKKKQEYKMGGNQI